MKKILIALAATLASIALIPANTNAQDALQFGIHIDPGVNWFFANNRDFGPDNAGFSLDAGFHIAYFFSERFGIASGVSYDLRNASLEYRYNLPAAAIGIATNDQLVKIDGVYKVTTKDDGVFAMVQGDELKTQAHYVKVPLGVKMRAIQIGYLTVTAELGISGNFLVRQRVYTDGRPDDGPLKGSPLPEILKTQTIDMFPWAFMGYYIRPGVEYSLGGRSAIAAGLAYNGTFTSVLNPGKGYIGAHNISVRIGFMF